MNAADPNSVEALIEIARHYYPPGLYDSDPGYLLSEEALRLEEAREKAGKNNSKWVNLLERLKEALPEAHIEDWTYLRHDASYRCRIYLPGAGPGEAESTAVVACVSILAPLYLLYVSQQQHIGGRHPAPDISYTPLPGTEPYWNEAARQIEAIFGFDPIDLEAGSTPVPNIVVGNVGMGKATLLDALFTDDRW